jgi:hypothetical protein
MAIPENSALCSYSGDPMMSVLDAVRFWTQDTDTSFWLLTDIEYLYLIDWISVTTNDDPMWIASVACTVIASKFTREVPVSADGVSVDVGQLQQKYRDLAMTLRDAYDETHGSLVIPWNTIYAHSNAYNDPSIPALLFGIGMNDNFEAGRQDYGNRRLSPAEDYTDLEGGP